jgi:hypothetical protein
MGWMDEVRGWTPLVLFLCLITGIPIWANHLESEAMESVAIKLFGYDGECVVVRKPVTYEEIENMPLNEFDCVVPCDLNKYQMCCVAETATGKKHHIKTAYLPSVLTEYFVEINPTSYVDVKIAETSIAAAQAALRECIVRGEERKIGLRWVHQTQPINPMTLVDV